MKIVQVPIPRVSGIPLIAGLAAVGAAFLVTRQALRVLQPWSGGELIDVLGATLVGYLVFLLVVSLLARLRKTWSPTEPAQRVLCFRGEPPRWSWSIAGGLVLSTLPLVLLEVLPHSLLVQSLQPLRLPLLVALVGCAGVRSLSWLLSAGWLGLFAEGFTWESWGEPGLRVQVDAVTENGALVCSTSEGGLCLRPLGAGSEHWPARLFSREVARTVEGPYRGRVAQPGAQPEPQKHLPKLLGSARAWQLSAGVAAVGAGVLVFRAGGFAEVGFPTWSALILGAMVIGLFLRSKPSWYLSGARSGLWFFTRHRDSRAPSLGRKFAASVANFGDSAGWTLAALMPVALGFAALYGAGKLLVALSEYTSFLSALVFLGAVCWVAVLWYYAIPVRLRAGVLEVWMHGAWAPVTGVEESGEALRFKAGPLEVRCAEPTSLFRKPEPVRLRVEQLQPFCMPEDEVVARDQHRKEPSQ